MHSVGVDFGFSSSRTAIVMTERIKILNPKTNRETIKVIVRFAEEYDKANPQDIVNICFDLHRKYWNTLIVDGTNRCCVTELKIMFNENVDFEYKDISPNNMRVIPVNFMKDHKETLNKLHLMMHKQYIGVPKEHEELITSLRRAQASQYSLDKDQTSHFLFSTLWLAELRLACASIETSLHDMLLKRDGIKLAATRSLIGL